jgi:AcrR family transcriptional regulator
VFGRDGYARASIDEIAREAGVSNRTIYNHFVGKDELFSALLTESARVVSDAFLAAVEAPAGGSDPVSELRRLGMAIARQRTAFPEHFALAARLRGEEGHFPDAVIDAWLDAGPRRVQTALTARMRDLADRGLIRATDPQRAALHLGALVTAGLSPTTQPDRAPTPQQIKDAVNTGVTAFLHGYSADGSPTRRSRTLP